MAGNGLRPPRRLEIVGCSEYYTQSGVDLTPIHPIITSITPGNQILPYSLQLHLGDRFLRSQSHKAENFVYLGYAFFYFFFFLLKNLKSMFLILLKGDKL